MSRLLPGNATAVTAERHKRTTTDKRDQTLLGKFGRHFCREEPLGNCTTFYNLRLQQFVNQNDLHLQHMQAGNIYTNITVSFCLTSLAIPGKAGSRDHFLEKEVGAPGLANGG